MRRRRRLQLTFEIKINTWTCHFTRQISVVDSRSTSDCGLLICCICFGPLEFRIKFVSCRMWEGV